MYCKTLLGFLTFCLMVFIYPAVANADLITFAFQGEVTLVDPLLSSEFLVGESVVGHYTFESFTPDSEPADPLKGIYLDSITSFTATFGGDYTVTQGVSSGIQVVDGILSPDVYTTVLEQPAGSSVAGLSPGYFFFSISDTSSTVFDSDALPLTPPDLASFDGNLSELLFLGSQASSVEFELSLLEIIPEPATAALALAATLFLVGRRRR